MISPDFDFEKSLLPPHCRFLLGIDEVGRGPLAGPVTIGGFVLDLEKFDPIEFSSLPVRDSKLLSAAKRESIYKYFQDQKFQFVTFSASSAEIDSQGIAPTIYSLIASVYTHFQSQFDFAIVDGNYSLDLPHYLSVISGDAKCFSVAAASICAKVVRDKFMDSLDSEFPQYGFKQHKGYGTAAHLKALSLHGPCPHHRRSYKPVSSFFSL